MTATIASSSSLRVNQVEESGRLVLELAGVLDHNTSPDFAHRLGGLDAHPGGVVLDLGGLSRIDSTGVAVILEARDRLAAARTDLKLRHAAPQVRKVFALTLARADELQEEAPDRFWDPLGMAGEAAVQVKQWAIESVQQIGEIAYWILIAPFRGFRIRVGATLEQIALMGADAIPIVSLIALLIGLIMGMQAAHQLRQFGASIFVADLVGIATTRELGPFITAIVVAGRSGSSIAAELGTMVVTEEIDALRTMGLNPMRYLVVPRCLALAIALPGLAVIADVVAIFGGMLIGVFNLGLSFPTYWNETLHAVQLSDFLTGVLKALVFGVVIANVGVFEGLHVKGGAEGVGRATTRAVVASILLIIVTDTVFTTLFYFV
jgi:phospholipid/cholesterol/gamma-HCH transport system permease protein